MGIWRPDTTTQQSTLTLARGDNPSWTYTLQGRELTQFPEGSAAVLEFRNSFDQVIDTWDSEVSEGVVSFIDITVAEGDAIPRGTTFTFAINDDADRPRQRLWGMVVRNQARYPENPDSSTQFETVQYQYSFGTPGFLVDPSWRIMNGHPRVYDNSGESLPNAVGAGSLLSGDFTFFDDVAMLYYAPVKTDAVRFTYDVVKKDEGEAWIVICSNYDMTNFAAIRHTDDSGFFGGTDRVAICTGSGPVTIQNRVQINHVTNDLDNFTAEYNPASNTYALYQGTNHTPLITWTDTLNLVNHGLGERYIGAGFKSGFLTPGVEMCDFYVQDAV